MDAGKYLSHVDNNTRDYSMQELMSTRTRNNPNLRMKS